MTEQTFTFTAEQIKIICEAARDTTRDDFTWDGAFDTFAQIHNMVNEGKPEAEQVSRETVFGWFGVKPPFWAKEHIPRSTIEDWFK